MIDACQANKNIIVNNLIYFFESQKENTIRSTWASRDRAKMIRTPQLQVYQHQQLQSFPWVKAQHNQSGSTIENKLLGLIKNIQIKGQHSRFKELQNILFWLSARLWRRSFLPHTLVESMKHYWKPFIHDPLQQESYGSGTNANHGIRPSLSNNVSFYFHTT